MSTLVLEMRAGELMVVNGASLRFRSRTRVELVAKARFLFGKQVMTPEAANTPARRIYFALQCAYVGPEDDREAAMADAHRLVSEFQEATTSLMARQLLERSLALAEQDEWYQALRLVRHVMRHEATVLGLDAATGLPVPVAGMAAPGMAATGMAATGMAATGIATAGIAAVVTASAMRPHVD